MAAPASAEAKDKYLEKIEHLHLVGVSVIRATPKGYDPAHDAQVGLYIHGGGYTMMSPDVTMHAYAPAAASLGESAGGVRFSSRLR
jgi:acetyl esterase/lipase